MINSFRDEYFFLSNFYKAPISYLGLTYTNNESAFQSMKSTDIEVRKEFVLLEPNSAKRKGRRVKLREDWEQIKITVMYQICLSKFIQNPDIKEKLLATGDEYLEEGNTWGDRTWGTVNGVGKNYLGNILMQVREDIKTISNSVIYFEKNLVSRNFINQNNQSPGGENIS